ncbi:MAG: hypothetical protein LUC88_10490 [Prevotella sp.]|nr:hypothetical protein [Prevotella sp.]
MRTYLFLLVMSLTLVSCSQKAKKETQVDEEQQRKNAVIAKAKLGLADYIYTQVYNPDVFEIRDFEIQYVSDSLCVFVFRALAENGFGGHVNTKCGYVFMKYDNEWYDHLEDKVGDGDVVLSGAFKVHRSLADDVGIRMDKNKEVIMLHDVAKSTGDDHYYNAYSCLI